MQRPTKPRKPTKPKLGAPTREVVDRLYLYWVTSYLDNGSNTEGYKFVKDGDANVPYSDEEDETEPYEEFLKAESVELPKLLQLLADNNIDPAKVTIENERYYRKSDGQIVLKVVRALSDEDYTDWVTRNQTVMDQYNRDLRNYPAQLEAYTEQKKLWDIHQAELRLEELRRNA